MLPGHVLNVALCKRPIQHAVYWKVKVRIRNFLMRYNPPPKKKQKKTKKTRKLTENIKNKNIPLVPYMHPFLSVVFKNMNSVSWCMCSSCKLEDAAGDYTLCRCIQSPQHTCCCLPYHANSCLHRIIHTFSHLSARAAALCYMSCRQYLEHHLVLELHTILFCHIPGLLGLSTALGTSIWMCMFNDMMIGPCK